MPHPLLQHPSIAELSRAIVRESRRQLLAGVLLWGTGVALGILFFRRHPLLAALALVFIVLGARWIYAALRMKNPAQHPLMQILSRQPQAVVWVYAVNFEIMPFGVQLIQRGDLHLRLADGSAYVLSMPAKRLRLVSHTLSRLLPHATFGYSPDREAVFLANPEGLRKKEDV